MQLKEIYLVDSKRTPQAKAGTTLMDVPVPHLGVELVRFLLDKHNIPTDSVDEVVFGNTGTQWWSLDISLTLSTPRA